MGVVECREMGKTQSDEEERRSVEYAPSSGQTTVKVLKEMRRTNVVSLSGSRIDCNEHTTLETESEGGGTVSELDRVVLVTLECVHQKVLGLCHLRI